jgi:hypothetical protein
VSLLSGGKGCFFLLAGFIMIVFEGFYISRGCVKYWLVVFGGGGCGGG